MSNNEIILFDLANQQNKCWSYNPWKARLVLNYKSLPYRTQWTEYPDLERTLRARGVPPNPPTTNPRAAYSSPTIQLPHGGPCVMDSYAIATEIDRRHPSPPLRLDSPGVARTQAAVDRVVEALAPVAIPRVPGMILNPVSREFCDDARFRRRFGVTLRELEEGEKGGEAAWGNAREGLEEVRGLLGEHAGPFVLGEEPSYADFILAGVWGFCERLDQGGDLYGRLMEMDEKFREHHEACRPWMKRDD